jgi:tetratricopeptide (TPR) repeat protein
MLLVQCHISLLERRYRNTQVAKKLHDSAMTCLDLNSTRVEAVEFHDAMAAVLMKLGEYRRALPFCEQAIQRTLMTDNPLELAEKLMRAARCYNSMGLGEHAVKLARIGLQLTRTFPNDPRLPGHLITLGNALRKTQPAESESLYREALDIHIAKGYSVSATTAWVDLGLLCSAQGRHAESLEYYENALEVREQNPKTRPVSIGLLLNNLANCHRRRGAFEEAHMRLDQSVEVLQLDKMEGTRLLANTYGTRGQILKDQGRYLEAVEWLRRAYDERINMPSPNFESMIEILEDEIAALRTLGREEEAASAQARLGAVKSARNEIAPMDFEFDFSNQQVKAYVLIEIAHRNRHDFHYDKPSSRKLALKLLQATKSQDANSSAKTLTIAESTTFIFHGEDAEALFQALHPILTVESFCRGAAVTIRQGKVTRQLTLPDTSN